MTQEEMMRDAWQRLNEMGRTLDPKSAADRLTYRVTFQNLLMYRQITERIDGQEEKADG